MYGPVQEEQTFGGSLAHEVRYAGTCDGNIRRCSHSHMHVKHNLKLYKKSFIDASEKGFRLIIPF